MDTSPAWQMGLSKPPFFKNVHHSHEVTLASHKGPHEQQGGLSKANLGL